MESNWREYTLHDVGVLQRGKSKHRPRWAEHLYGGNYPFVQTGDVRKADKLITNFEQTYSESGLSQSKLWPKGTLCITIAANIAEIGILNFDSCFPDSVLGFIADENKTTNDFVYYLIKFFKKEIQRFAIGSVQDNINLGTFNKVTFKFPPLPEQKRIAHILGSLDDKIELNRQMNQTLEQMAQALFKSWFVDFDPVIDNALAAGNPIPEELQAKTEKRKALGKDRKALPEDIQKLFPDKFEFSEELKKWVPLGWKVGKLEEIAKFSNGKTSPNRTEGEIPVYGSNGQIGKCNTYNREDIIVIGRVGSYCGSLYYFDNKCWVTDNAMSAEMFDKLNNTYLFEQLKRANLNDRSTGSGQPLINQSILKSIEIIIPNERLIKEFAIKSSTLYKKRFENNNINQKLIQLRDTLLPKLISGEVRVPDIEGMIE